VVNFGTFGQGKWHLARPDLKIAKVYACARLDQFNVASAHSELSPAERRVPNLS
jgi:hypothetical protein